MEVTVLFCWAKHGSGSFSLQSDASVLSFIAKLQVTVARHPKNCFLKVRSGTKMLRHFRNGMFPSFLTKKEHNFLAKTTPTPHPLPQAILKQASSTLVLHFFTTSERGVWGRI